MTEKIYINGLFIKQKEFENGGNILKVSIRVDDFVAELQQHAKDGWVNIDICKRKLPSEKGHTHYAQLNQFSPTQAPKIEDCDLP